MREIVHDNNASSMMALNVKDEESISSLITQNFEFGRSKQAKLFPVSGVEVETSTSTVWDLSAIEILPCRKSILITQLTSPSVTNTSYTPGMVTGDLSTNCLLKCWKRLKLVLLGSTVYTKVFWYWDLSTECVGSQRGISVRSYWDPREYGAKLTFGIGMSLLP